jgi:hypothetical protein
MKKDGGKRYVCATEFYIRISFEHVIKLFFVKMLHCENGSSYSQINTVTNTICNKDFLEHITLIQLIKKFHSISRTQRFNTANTKSHQWVPS